MGTRVHVIQKRRLLMRYNDEKKEAHAKWEKKDGQSRVKQAWRAVMNSTKHKMSQGAEFISRMIPWARKEDWRRSKGHSTEKKKD